MKTLLASMALACATTAAAATLTVLNTADSGPGSLRQAILDSNASPGVVDTIAFNITGAGCAGVPAVCTIKPATALDNVADPVIIDGYTQPGSSPNTLAVGDDAVLLVELDGSLVGGNGIGLSVLANNTVIKGLVINRFTYVGIFIDATGGGSLGGHTVRGNFIGTDPSGTLAAGCGTWGIFLRAPNSNIGGPNPGDRNVISANGINSSFGANLRLEGDFGATVSGVAVQGNYIGTNAGGTGSLGGGAGVALWPGSGVAIGGPATGQGNVISGNGNYGISMFWDCVTFLENNVIQGNWIGVDASGAPLGNAAGGIYIGCLTRNNQIGGTAAGAGNTIAHNGGSAFSVGAGIFLDSTGTGNQIRANLIFSNKGLGIAFGGSTPTPNDAGDGDTGSNNLQNFPIILSSAPGAGNTHVTGKFRSAPSTTFDVDFFANAACSNFPREFLGGETYLGASPVTTDGSGNATIDVTLPVASEAGARISATATDPAGNTSEFSQRIVFALTGATSGPAAGGTAIGVSGTDFADPSTMTIGGVSTPVTFANDHALQSTSPALSPGTVNDLIVTTPDSTTGTLPKAWVADFLDVPGSQQFHSYVTTLVSNAITAGVGGGLYGVDQPTLRQQMAVFLMKAKHGLCYTPPPCTVAVFTDVPCSSGFASWINELVAEGITGGCGNGTTYCPTDPVKRQQMAVLLLRTLEGSGYAPPACVTASFGDVPCDSPFAPWIYELVARAITGGCGNGNYCPVDPATRGQMAVFVTKTFNLQ